MTPTLTGFVAGEINAGRCTVPKPTDGHYVVKVDVAVLVGADGMIRRTVPHAIQCPTVEQYAAGMVSSFARNNLLARAGDGSGWFRASVTFDWPA